MARADGSVSTRVLVLGAGMVGKVIAADLADEPGFRVTVADVNPDALGAARSHARASVETVAADLSNPDTVTRLAAEADLVVGALASAIGHGAMRAVLDAGRPLSDISFIPTDARELDTLARERGATAVFDMGVAPGMSNLLAAHAARELDRCDRIRIYVGGIPAEPRGPFRYKAPFAPADVLEEYTRPARQVEEGRVVVHEALSGVERLDLPEVGTLEAFHTDGLRSLADSGLAPSMTEKTLRWPGHADLMLAFRAAGLFSTEPVEVDGVEVVPRSLTSRLLFPLWSLDEGEEDLTVMRIVAEGERAGRACRIAWELLDRTDSVRGESSMARTTGFPCALVARMLADGRLEEPGVLAPERLAERPALVGEILEGLEERGVRFRRTEEAGEGVTPGDPPT